MPSKYDLQIIIPAFNEQKLIKESIHEIEKYFSSFNFKIGFIIIDDASTDQTWQEITTISKKRNNIRAIQFARNFGKEASIRAGLELATAEYSITVDADGEHPFSEIPNMLSIAKSQKANIVYAQRSTNRKTKSFIRNSIAKLFGNILGVQGLKQAGLTDFILLDLMAREEFLKNPKGIYRLRIQELGFKKISYLFTPIFITRESRWTSRKLTDLAFKIVINHSNILQRFLISLALVLIALILGLTLKSIIGQSSQVPTGYYTLLFLLLINLTLTLISISYVYLFLIKMSNDLSQNRYSVWKKI
jgi:glycosyltransferase involved in cell wall biosynthesis